LAQQVQRWEFSTTSLNKREVRPGPNPRGDAFGIELTKNSRLLSSGVNLAFERLLLGASLQLQLKITSSNPRESGSEPTTPTYNMKEALLCFAGKRRHRRSPDEGLGRRARREL
jgi:hypothetical protein